MTVHRSDHAKAAECFRSAAEKGGGIKPKPTPLLAKLVLPVPALMILPTVLTYLISVPLNGEVRPTFVKRWTLPDFGLSAESINMLKMAGCLSLVGTWNFFTYSMDLLQVREKPKLVSTGPYGIYAYAINGFFQKDRQKLTVILL